MSHYDETIKLLCITITSLFSPLTASLSSTISSQRTSVASANMKREVKSVLFGGQAQQVSLKSGVVKVNNRPLNMTQKVFKRQQLIGNKP